MSCQKDMVQVDAYWVPKAEAPQYKEEREWAFSEISAIFNEFCQEVKREWAGSEDGEAVTGYNKEKELVAVMHLDPYTIAGMKQAQKENQLTEYVLECNGLKKEQ